MTLNRARRSADHPGESWTDASPDAPRTPTNTNSGDSRRCARTSPSPTTGIMPKAGRAVLRLGPGWHESFLGSNGYRLPVSGPDVKAISIWVGVFGWVSVCALLAAAAAGLWLQFAFTPDATLAWDDIEALQDQIARGYSVADVRRIWSTLAVASTMVWFATMVTVRRRPAMLSGWCSVQALWRDGWRVGPGCPSDGSSSVERQP